MASVTVTPDAFTLVAFDPGRIRAAAEQLADECGLADREIRIEVDETTPFGRARIESLDPLVIAVEGGAFEDPKRPKQHSDQSTVTSLGRILGRAADRIAGGFADAPADDDLDPARSTAWDAYVLGRCARRGHPIAQPRFQYHFRTRHGFSDAADAAFERLWNADSLTWPELEAISAAAREGAGATA